MLTAIVKSPAPTLAEACELTFMNRGAMNFDLLAWQHGDYCDALQRVGSNVVVLPPSPDFADSVFVEDTAVILDTLAIITRPGVLSRRGESALIEPYLAPYRRIVRIEAPGTLDGGDVLRIGRTLFVGLSTRTNADGIKQLTQFVQPLGYSLVAVRVMGSLHLKTACTALDDSTVLLNPDWIDGSAFGAFARISVAANETFAANVLAIGVNRVVNAAFPRTLELIGKHLQATSAQVIPVDISEFGKAEAGLSCMSLLVENQTDVNAH